ncbi:MAG: ferrochelatase [Bacteroidetes bacterium]|nr:ferrochelatase [Bacteroidota bacterium]
MKRSAILLMNLGSPDLPEVKELRSYLSEFLMDKRVIDIPYLLRFLLVKGIIVPFRSYGSAKRYKSIWTDNGSPLINITKQLTQKVKDQTGNLVEYCMRYGNPTPESAFERLFQQEPKLDEVVLFPLFPHYAMSSYESAVERVKDVVARMSKPMDLKIIPPYFQDEDYIAALVDSIRPFMNKNFDHILFSYHGVPERHIRKSDVTGKHCLNSTDCCSKVSQAHANCYRHQLLKTTSLVCGQLELPTENYSVSFQSRLGRDSWLQPFTTEVLKELPSKGVNDLLLVCPAFVSDCLETLEEMEIEGRSEFLKAGGRTFKMIPCLNVSQPWVQAIDEIIKKN